jgi:ATP-dependent Clp protease ATP-binding subunit ClpA
LKTRLTDGHDAAGFRHTDEIKMDARVDEIVIFRRQSPEHITGVMEIQLGRQRKRLPERDITLEIETSSVMPGAST